MRESKRLGQTAEEQSRESRFLFMSLFRVGAIKGVKKIVKRAIVLITCGIFKAVVFTLNSNFQLKLSTHSSPKAYSSPKLVIVRLKALTI